MFEAFRVSDYKGVIFIILVIVGLILVKNKGPEILLYLFCIFAWFGGFFVNLGPLTLLFRYMAFPEFAILGAFIISFAKNKKEKIPYLRLLLIFWAFCIYNWLTGIHPDLEFAVNYTRKCVLLPVLGFVAAYKLLDSAKKRETLVISAMIGVSLICTLSIITITAIVISKPSMFSAIISSGRYNFSVWLPVIGSVDLGGNQIASHASMAVNMLFVVFITETKKYIRWASIIGIVISLGVIFATGCRTPMITLLVTISVILLFASRQKISKRFFYLVFGVISLIVLMNIFASIGLMTDLSKQRVQETTQIFDSPVEYLFQSNHGRNWQAFFDAAPHYPLGAGFFESLKTIGGPDLGLHSQYGYLYFGTGFPGMAIYFGVLLVAVFWAFRFRAATKQEYWTVLASAAAIITYFFNTAMVHTVLVHGADLYAYMFAAVIFKQVKEAQRSLRGRNNSRTENVPVHNIETFYLERR